MVNKTQMYLTISASNTSSSLMFSISFATLKNFYILPKKTSSDVCYGKLFFNFKSSYV